MVVAVEKSLNFLGCDENRRSTRSPRASVASVVRKSVESVNPFVSLNLGGEKRFLFVDRCSVIVEHDQDPIALWLNLGSGGYSIGSNAIAFNLGNGLSDQSLASPAPSVYSPMGGGGAYTQNFSGATRGESQSQFTTQLQQGSQEYTQNYYNGTASGFLYNTLTALPRSWQQYTPFGWAGSGLAATGNTISGWGNAAARQGDSNAGTAAMFTGGLFNAASGILNPIGSAENLGAASADVGTMYGNAAGIGYGIGSLIGATQITQAITGENFATGQSLVGLNRWGMAFQGISAASGTAALGAGTWNAGTVESTTPALNILNPEFTPNAGAWLQNATDRAAAEIGANPELARTILSRPEYEAGTRSLGIARMQFGNAVEGKVEQYWFGDPLAKQMLDYTGNGPGPDFTGIGFAQGQTFDISTALGRESHWLRPYGAGMQVITYSRPAGFTVFPPLQEAP